MALDAALSGDKGNLGGGACDGRHQRPGRRRAGRLPQGRRGPRDRLRRAAARRARRRAARCSTSPRGSASPGAPAPGCSRRRRATNAPRRPRGRLRARPRPRLRDARRAVERRHRRRLAAPSFDALWLHHADPLRTHPDRAAWEAALETAQTVIAVDSVLTDTIREHADVVFPAEAYAEKEGTLTHPDGRVQRLRPAIGRPKGRDGQSGSGVRPLWQVIADVAEGDRAGPGHPHRPDRLPAALRRRAVLRRADARRDRRPRHPLADQPGRERLRGRAVGAGQARGPLRRAAPDPRARCAWARSARCGPPRRSTSRRRWPSCARARSSSSRPPTPSGSGSARATRSRSAPTAPA